MKEVINHKMKFILIVHKRTPEHKIHLQHRVYSLIKTKKGSKSVDLNPSQYSIQLL